MLESMVSAYQPGTDTYTYPALFHSVSAFMKSDHRLIQYTTIYSPYTRSLNRYTLA